MGIDARSLLEAAKLGDTNPEPAIANDAGELHLAWLQSLSVPMGFVGALKQVAALGLCTYLRTHGVDTAQILWPSHVVCGTHQIACVEACAGYLSGIVGGIDVRLYTELPEVAALEPSEILEAVCDAIDGWVDAVKRGVAAPLAPCVEAYFDLLAAQGEQVLVHDLRNNVHSRARLAGLDIWGRITLVASDGTEQEYAPEQARIARIDSADKCS